MKTVAITERQRGVLESLVEQARELEQTPEVKWWLAIQRRHNGKVAEFAREAGIDLMTARWDTESMCFLVSDGEDIPTVGTPEAVPPDDEGGDDTHDAKDFPV